MSLKLLLALSLQLTSVAQAAADPELSVDLRQPGSLHASLLMAEPVPEEVAQAFAQALGCPPDSLQSVYERRYATYTVEVSCPVRVKPAGLRGTLRWDLTGLNAALRRAAAEGIEVEVFWPRSSSVKFIPDGRPPDQLAESSGHFQRDFLLGEFTYIELEVGGLQSALWLLGAAAGVIWLLPLLLYGARRGGRLPTLAAATGLFWLGATVWLCAVMRVNPPAVMPFPWSFAVVFLPMAAAIGAGSRIAGGPRWLVPFWRGVRVAALLTAYVGIFSITQAKLWWVGCCLVAIAISTWGFRRANRRRFEPITRGALLTRVRELAERAGAKVKSLQLLLGGEELPAAFGSPRTGILISGAMLTTLSRREVDAIAAHELSHVRRGTKPPAKVLGMVGGATVTMALLIPGSFPWTPLVLPPAFLLHQVLRRRMERRADADAVAWSGDAEALITGLARGTRSGSMPLEWPFWVKPLMPHPSTMERARRTAAQAGISEERLAGLLEASTNPAEDRYPIADCGPPFGSAFTPGERARLNLTLQWVFFLTPVLFGAAAPFIGLLAALLMGACSFLLACEWILASFRARARAQLSGRPGVFAGFSPSAEYRLFDGSLDYDWGFAAFEGDCLVFRGDRGTWQVNRAQIEEIRLNGGPFAWVPHPMICFRTRSEQVLSLRPFDHVFGLARRRAAAGLLDQAQRWHAAAAEGEAAAYVDAEPAFPQGEPAPPYTGSTFLRSLPAYAMYCVALYGAIAIAMMSDPTSGMDLGRMLETLPVAWVLAWFVAYPVMRRTPGDKLTAAPAPNPR